jgi:hypothetical protein
VESRGNAIRLRGAVEDRAENEVVDGTTSGRPSPPSDTECTERPIRKPGGAQPRTLDAGNESARKWTPCAPAATATSNRSFTTPRARVPRTALTQAVTRRVNGPPSRSRSRI